ncbi:uncharacterized protein LOC130994016 [Salvia miltiorrhiza]|uniref:uncharacterized protein LOC130994016 n=1 Tax=Salvia miltiorrhiza TaxID=226208 RepID=UPI0025AC697A|nr:uncharacterized protein LOC130994016 [Salvia miltiorrhiza]
MRDPHTHTHTLTHLSIGALSPSEISPPRTLLLRRETDDRSSPSTYTTHAPSGCAAQPSLLHAAGATAAERCCLRRPRSRSAVASLGFSLGDNSRATVAAAPGSSSPAEGWSHHDRCRFRRLTTSSSSLLCLGFLSLDSGSSSFRSHHHRRRPPPNSPAVQPLTTISAPTISLKPFSLARSSLLTETGQQTPRRGWSQRRVCRRHAITGELPGPPTSALDTHTHTHGLSTKI